MKEFKELRDFQMEEKLKLADLIQRLPRGWSLERADEYYPQEVDESLEVSERWCVFSPDPNWHWTDGGNGLLMMSDEESPIEALHKALNERT